MLPTLLKIAQHPDATELDNLIELFDAMRPQKDSTPEYASEKVRALTQILQTHPALASALKQHILVALHHRRHNSLYTDAGILTGNGFFSELFKRCVYPILPPALDDQYLLDCIGLLFPFRKDYIWLMKVPAEEWQHLIQTLVNAPTSLAPEEIAAFRHKTLSELLQAIHIVSYRVSAIGIEPELVRVYVDLKAMESPFITQNTELHKYIVDYQRFLETGNPDFEDAKQALVILDQCEDVVSKIRKSILKVGTSLTLTNRMVRLQQNLTRLRQLIDLVEAYRHNVACSTHPDTANTPADIQAMALELGLELIRKYNRKYKVREFYSQSVNLLARTVTENASRTGEHYIAETRKEYNAMFRSAAGAGLIIGFMAMFKIMASHLHAPPLIEAFLYSMNYSLGFMLIHILHFTVATKQPAMTASKIAASLHSSDGRNIDRESIIELVKRVTRTQFVAVLGNLLLAFPMAYVLAMGYLQLTGNNFVSPEKAQSLLHDLNPVTSLSLFHAAIAGVCLFLSGLISGYYDNKALYTRMSQRIRQAGWIQSLLGPQRAARFGDYIELTLGGLMGNFYFGILLGSMGTIGFLLGLPLDIRHITFSTANLAIAIVGLDNNISAHVLAISIIGVLLIGIVNLLVSFTLALLVALRSRQVHVRNSGTLINALFWSFLRHPLSFILPPKRSAENQAPPDDKH